MIKEHATDTIILHASIVGSFLEEGNIWSLINHDIYALDIIYETTWMNDTEEVHVHNVVQLGMDRLCMLTSQRTIPNEKISTFSL